MAFFSKTKDKVKTLAVNGYGFVKAHWSQPLEGEYLSIKEFLSYCFGNMGVSAFTYLAGETVAFTAGYFCGSIMGISLMDFSIISIIALIVRYATIYMEPLTMTVFENLGKVDKKTAKKCIIAYSLTIILGIACYCIPPTTWEMDVKIIKGLPQIVGNILIISGAGNFVNWFVRSKLCRRFGRYKPFMLLYGIPITIITSLIPFVPTTLEYTTKLVLLHALFTLRSRFTALYSDNSLAIVAVISPNSVERQKLYSIGGIAIGLLRSIFRIIFPMMIVLTGGYLDIRSYQIFIPILSAISCAVGFILIQVKERIAENYETKPKVKFGTAAKKLLKNKFFWLINICAIFEGWNGYADGVMNYFLIYNLRLEWISGIVGIVGITSVIGNLATPTLIKRFEKRNVLLIVRVAWIAITACYLVAIKLDSVALLILFVFIRSALTACSNGISRSLNADILDYHQWKTGERADNMVTMFSWFTTPLTTIIGLIIPMLFERVGFTSDWDVMFDSGIFQDVTTIYVIVAVCALTGSTIPYLFYNLTRAQHAQCVKEIRERVEAERQALDSQGELALEVAGADVGACVEVSTETDNITVSQEEEVVEDEK